MTSTQVSEDSIVETLDRFFAAIERRDLAMVEAMYADDIEVFHNWTKKTLGKAAAVDVLRGGGAISGLRYEVLSRHVGDDFIVQRHVLHGTAPGGQLAVPVCITFEFRDHLITKIYEYLDSAELTVLAPPASA